MKKVHFLHKHNVTSDTICGNISANAGRDLPSVSYKCVCVCASGPSLKDALPFIRRRVELGFSVASMNGSHNFLVENGIVPDYFFMVDARKGINLPFVDKPNDYTTYVIASQCDPEIFDALKGRNVMLWQVGNSFYEDAEETIKGIAPDATIFPGACNIGHSCLGALLAFGYRRMHLFGFDGPTRSGATHAFYQSQNSADELMEFVFENERFTGSATSAHDAQAFVSRYRALRDIGIEVQVFGDGLLPTMVAAAQRNDNDALRNAMLPAPNPRTKPVEKLQIVCWKWRGHIPYTADHVNRLANMVGRWLNMPHEIVCITDDPEGIDGGVRIVPMWRDNFEFGRDWHRLKIFAPEMADIIGPRFVSMDLDTVICGPLDELFGHDAPFKAWRDPLRSHQYCTALFQMDAGAWPHVIDTFDAEAAMELRRSGRYNGYDQAWISYLLPGQPMWTAKDGVLSFKVDILHGDEISLLEPPVLPGGTKIINFHGKFDPSQGEVQACIPWIVEHWV